MSWQTFLIACSIVAIIEGIGPMLFPRRWQNYIQQMSSKAPGQLQQIGGILVVAGVVSLFFLI